MGIFWSCCEDNEDVCHGCSRRGLHLINDECQFCRNSRLATHIRSLEETRARVPRNTRAYRPPARVARSKPAYVIPKKERRGRLFGEFRCPCGRQWNSRNSWLQKNQKCRECKNKVLAHTQRELRPEDMEEHSRGASMDHREDLCEMCEELGYYCGKYKY